MAEVINVDKWISENKKDFVPPVCNKCMYSDQLKMFFVGGPNQRRDYHLEEGEEVFYQLKGSMCLKVIEKGVKKDVVIKEGEIFVLPSRVEHSPQRFENTIGAVVERTRAEDEFDCVRYFLDDTTTRQFERWFHINDVVIDLPPLIRAFHASKSFETNSVTDESFLQKEAYKPREIFLRAPLNLKEFIANSSEELKTGPVTIFGAPEYTSSTAVYGVGEYGLTTGVEEECIVWSVLGGEAKVEVGGELYSIKKFDMARVQPEKKFILSVREGTVIVIRMPPAKRN
ncbi:hypothetical protein PFISCL1PPCAC_289 [Pristionchus fissidentatus]|uniref:3-hydroxyanthranilate 3,4-dioxygenase n=1 Tax=Pristionchus fissidentatus TaxID=1538716 RepID=A0AAV5UPH9_9BILA|nr:hypothetical protein PFISCL1PPCAC_289 [Pristionchus fissidentatus]